MLVRFLRDGWFAVFIAMALTPMLFALGPNLESKLFPVVDNTKVEDVTPLEGGGVAFHVNFDQLRQCEFLGIAWYQGPLRVGVAFEPDSELYPKTRTEGAKFAGPWSVKTVSSLKDTRAYVYHRCHPLWTTVSNFYP